MDKERLLAAAHYGAMNPVRARLVERLRAAETIGRPLGPPAFLDRLAALAGRERGRGSAAESPASPCRPQADGPDPEVLK